MRNVDDSESYWRNAGGGISVLFDGQLCVFEMFVARSHARALLHVVLAVAPGSPGFATVVTGIRFKFEMHA